MIARSSLLRALLRRTVKIDGPEGSFDTINDCVILRTAKSGKEGNYVNDGETVVLTTDAGVYTDDNVLFVKYHPAFLDAGLVSGPTIISSSDKKGPVTFRFEASQDLDLDSLEYIAKLYVEGN